MSLDMLFICLPADLVHYFKNIFSKSNILIDQIICSSYAKSINYKDNLDLSGHISFIDIGFSKTSIISYFNDKILFINILPIGGNHITRDISKVLQIDIKQAEKIKLNFDKSEIFLNDENLSQELFQKIVFARIEEILEICAKCIQQNLIKENHPKMILMGGGSKILDNQHKDQISFSNDIDFIDETDADICHSGFKLVTGLNKQEVVVIPKKQIKQGFFEKLFHFFK